MVSIAPGPEDGIEDVAEEDAPQNSMRGIITVAAGKLRELRDGEDETPADGVDAPPAKGQQKAKGGPKPPKKRRRPGWAAVIVGILAGGPTYTELREVFKDAFGMDEAVAEAKAEAKALGVLEGRLDDQEEQLGELRSKLAANTAGDIEDDYNGALEFRHLDRQLGALGRNIDRLMDAESIPGSERTALIETPLEIAERHNREIERYRRAREKAEKQAIERAVEEDDTVTGP